MPKSSSKVVFWSAVTVAGLGVTLAVGSSAGQRVLGSWQDSVATWSSVGVLASGVAGGLAVLRRAGQAVLEVSTRISSAVRGGDD